MLGRIKAFLENLTDLDAEDLMPGEQVIFESKRYWFSEGVIIIVAALAVVGSVALVVYGLLSNIRGFFSTLMNGAAVILFFSGLLFSANVIMSHYSIRYFLTDYRVVKRTGIFTKKIIYVPYDKIQNVRIDKTVTERLIDIGDIYIDTAGGEGAEMVMEDIPDPERIHNLILQKMMEKGEHHDQNP